MKRLESGKVNSVRNFIRQYARPLDVALCNYLFDKTDKNKFLSELEKFQNPDGGFGYGLEPDFRTPLSSNMATTCAFQYLKKAKILELPTFLKQGVEYLAQNYDKENSRWIPVPEKSNDSPHAEWWNFDIDKYKSEESWGNPTVEIIGYLLKYESSFDKTEISRLKEFALKRLFESQEVEVHEMMCYQRFAKSLASVTKKTIFDKLIQLALRQVERDSSKWHTYVSRPLFFVDGQDSPVFEYLHKEVEQELDYMIDSVDQSGGWMPNWDWHQYNKEWENIKFEVAGMVTVNNLIILREFGRI